MALPEGQLLAVAFEVGEDRAVREEDGQADALIEGGAVGDAMLLAVAALENEKDGVPLAQCDAELLLVALPAEPVDEAAAEAVVNGEAVPGAVEGEALLLCEPPPPLLPVPVGEADGCALRVSPPNESVANADTLPPPEREAEGHAEGVGRSGDGVGGGVRVGGAVGGMLPLRCGVAVGGVLALLVPAPPLVELPDGVPKVDGEGCAVGDAVPAPPAESEAQAEGVPLPAVGVPVPPGLPVPPPLADKLPLAVPEAETLGQREALPPLGVPVPLSVAEGSGEPVAAAGEIEAGGEGVSVGASDTETLPLPLGAPVPDPLLLRVPGMLLLALCVGPAVLEGVAEAQSEASDVAVPATSEGEALALGEGEDEEVVEGAPRVGEASVVALPLLLAEGAAFVGVAETLRVGATLPEMSGDGDTETLPEPVRRGEGDGEPLSPPPPPEGETDAEALVPLAVGEGDTVLLPLPRLLAVAPAGVAHAVLETVGGAAVAVPPSSGVVEGMGDAVPQGLGEPLPLPLGEGTAGVAVAPAGVSVARGDCEPPSPEEGDGDEVREVVAEFEGQRLAVPVPPLPVALVSAEALAVPAGALGDEDAHPEALPPPPPPTAAEDREAHADEEAVRVAQAEAEGLGEVLRVVDSVPGAEEALAGAEALTCPLPVAEACSGDGVAATEDDRDAVTHSVAEVLSEGCALLLPQALAKPLLEALIVPVAQTVAEAQAVALPPLPLAVRSGVCDKVTLSDAVAQALCETLRHAVPVPHPVGVGVAQGEAEAVVEVLLDAQRVAEVQAEAQFDAVALPLARSGVPVAEIQEEIDSEALVQNERGAEAEG